MSVHTSSRRERDAVRIFSEKLRSSHDKARRVALRARTPRCLTMWVDGMRAQRALLIPGHDRDRLAEEKVCLQRVASCCNPLIVKNRTCGLLALEPQRRDSCSRDEVKPPASVRPGDSRGKMWPPHEPGCWHSGRYIRDASDRPGGSPSTQSQRCASALCAFKEGDCGIRAQKPPGLST